MNNSRGLCGNSGRPCPTAMELGDSLSSSQMEDFGHGFNAQSTPIQHRPESQDNSYSLHMPSGRGTRIIKRTKVTRTSTDPDDPELQNDSSFFDTPGQSSSPGVSPKSHGSSGPDTYKSFQGHHQSIPNTHHSIPPMYKNYHPKNYDDSSAPALINTDRGSSTPKSPCYAFPPSSLPASPPQSSIRRPMQNPMLFNTNDNKSYNNTRTSPRSTYSTGYSPCAFGMESMPAAYGRSFDPGRVPDNDPRMDNQTAPGAMNTNCISRGRRISRGNESAPAAYGSSYSPARLPDPRMGSQTAPGGIMPHSGREAYMRQSGMSGVCHNATCSSNKSGGVLSGYEASGGSSHGSSMWPSPRPANVSVKYPAAIPRRPAQIPNVSDPVSTSPGSASYYTSEGSGIAKTPVPWTPRDIGQFSYSSPSTEGTYYTTDGSNSGRSRGTPCEFTPRLAGHITGYTKTDPRNYAESSGCQVASCNYNTSDFRTPSARPQDNSRNYTDMSGGCPPDEIIDQSLQRSMNIPNVSGRNQNPSIPPSRDYFSLIENGSLTPTSKKKKIARQTTSAGSMVSEECEEVYDIPEDGIPTHISGQTGISSINEPNSNYIPTDGATFFNPQFTSSPNYKTGIEPATQGMPYYVGHGNRPPPRGDQSSTISDSFFRTLDSTSSGTKKGPCCCKKKGGKPGHSKHDPEHSINKGSKCENIGTPCKEKKSELSNRSGEGGAGGTSTDEPVNVFQAGRYDIATEASATHSVTPVKESKNCICAGASGNLSLDLERIEQEEFTQLSRNLSQWQQSRRKVVSKMDSFNNSKRNPTPCEAKCSNSKK